jgi:hypothetical protein
MRTPRMTTRQWMIAVALVAITLGGLFRWNACWTCAGKYESQRWLYMALAQTIRGNGISSEYKPLFRRTCRPQGMGPPPRRSRHQRLRGGGHGGGVRPGGARARSDAAPVPPSHLPPVGARPTAPAAIRTIKYEVSES